jgi:HSP20 family molecular chaperone IbpA
MTTTVPPTTSEARPTAAPAQTAERPLPTLLPRVDIYETDRSYNLVADMPGVTAEGLEVVAERNTLLIQGRVETSSPRPDYREFELGHYRRAFALSDDLDAAAVTATLRDGVLRVEIPKSPNAQPRKIPVRTE